MEEGRRRRRREPLDPKPKDAKKLKCQCLCLVLLTLVLAAATAAVLWRCRGEPLLVAWRLSLLLCLGSVLWMSFLSETMRPRAVFVRISYGALLACAADRLVSPNVGVVVVLLHTHFAAGLVGYALAERRQREGTERSVAAVVPVAKTEDEEKRLRALRMLGCLVFSLPALGGSAFPAWVVRHSAEYAVDGLVLSVLPPVAAASLFGVMFVAVFQLRGSLLVEISTIYPNFLKGVQNKVVD
ncbi:hypothetical protein BAE44_0017178 [Dichanthelium oligosanthes]|uniref:Uncharacterized protein n=1 Tax=Dichanthelium oligosanthes TaxID=888268 RepID=A0A1E5V9I3_9POAL|nr:hypothetical protein BAE44_0017178 [Dichanthelium oligosanthes]